MTFDVDHVGEIWRSPRRGFGDDEGGSIRRRQDGGIGSELRRRERGGAGGDMGVDGLNF